mmetsp:Transcript_57813/g.163144  ORF Transcript_57813/g.163144 Transcript_57813/m.163144 type:complete len:260 (-) Transcript_57813:1139-1918(-)
MRKLMSSSKSSWPLLSLSTIWRASLIMRRTGMNPRSWMSFLSSWTEISPLPSASYLSKATWNCSCSYGMYFCMKPWNSSKSMYSYGVISFTIGCMPSSWVMTWPKYRRSSGRSPMCRSPLSGTLKRLNAISMRWISVSEKLVPSCFAIRLSRSLRPSTLFHFDGAELLMPPPVALRDMLSDASMPPSPTWEDGGSASGSCGTTPGTPRGSPAAEHGPFVGSPSSVPPFAGTDPSTFAAHPSSWSLDISSQTCFVMVEIS